jgi:hypothetical protein
MRIALCVIAIFLLGCQPKPDFEARVKDLVVRTVASPSANFSSYSSYSLAIDTIGTYRAFTRDSLIVDEYSYAVSRAVKANMDKAGYKQVTAGQHPDLAVNILLSRGYLVDQTFPSPNYYFKRPGNYNYQFSGYGGYSPYPYIIPSYDNPAYLIIEIIDLKNKDAQQRVQFIWTAFMADVDAMLDPIARSVEGVNQAFVQSRYIKTP